MTLTFSRYNRARGVQDEFVNAMSEMMKRGVCLSGSHPLLAAVDRSHLDVKMLSSDYKPSHSEKETLKVVKFTDIAKEVTILDGHHRVLAARGAFNDVAENAEKLAAQVIDLERSFNNLGGRVTTMQQRSKVKLDTAKQDVKNVKKAMHNIQFWPVSFYDQGLMTFLVKGTATYLFTAKLRSIARDTQDFPGEQKNEDLLLHFLSENPQESSVLKSVDEKLADILFRNLYGPQPSQSWSHLVKGSRILKNVCERERVWRMVNAVMQVSPSLLGTEVTSASILGHHANNNSLGVSPQFIVTGQ